MRLCCWPDPRILWQRHSLSLSLSLSLGLNFKSQAFINFGFAQCSTKRGGELPTSPESSERKVCAEAPFGAGRTQEPDAGHLAEKAVSEPTATAEQCDHSRAENKPSPDFDNANHGPTQAGSMSLEAPDDTHSDKDESREKSPPKTEEEWLEAIGDALDKTATFSSSGLRKDVALQFAIFIHRHLKTQGILLAFFNN